MQDLWLLKLDGAAEAAHPRLAQLRALHPQLRAWHAPQDAQGYVYLPAAEPGEARPAGALSGEPWQHLRCTLALGAAAPQPAPCHYVVETDVLPGREDEFNAWYQDEHMPGLAAVPGTLWAMRYTDAGASATPRYYACYGLRDFAVLESPAWLAVRGTPWSDRVRPTFCNTRRTRFAQPL